VAELDGSAFKLRGIQIVKGDRQQYEVSKAIAIPG
jgi:hypothetical protein